MNNNKRYSDRLGPAIFFLLAICCAGWSLAVFASDVTTDVTVEADLAAAKLAKQWKSAIANDNVELIGTLWQANDFDKDLLALRADNGKSAFMIACKTGDLELFEAILASGEDPESETLTGGTPLMFAALGNRTAIVQRLLELKVDTDAQGSNGWSAMTIAAAKGYPSLIETLSSAGADVNARDVYGWTPIMRAVDNGHWPTVLLMSAIDGIDLDNQDEAGNTALHHAVVHGNIDMVKQLVSRGAARDIENYALQTPYELAIAELESGSGGSEDLLSVLSSK